MSDFPEEDQAYWEDLAQKMDSGEARGLEAWLPRDYVEAKRTGKPYKYPDWYLELEKGLEMLRKTCDSLADQARRKGLI